MDLKKLLDALPWQEMLFGAYKGVVRPWLAQMVASSDQKWDDAVFEHADKLAEKLLGNLAGEKDRAELTEQAKKDA